MKREEYCSKFEVYVNPKGKSLLSNYTFRQRIKAQMIIQDRQLSGLGV